MSASIVSITWQEQRTLDLNIRGVGFFNDETEMAFLFFKHRIFYLNGVIKCIPIQTSISRRN